jgi:hypothetical protein
MSTISEILLISLTSLNTLFAFHNRDILYEILKQLKKIKK